MIQRRSDPVVILVEGDPVIVSTLRKALHDEPFELRATANPNRALKWLEEGDARLLLANPDMPAVQETGFLHAVEERYPGTACAILSAGERREAPAGPPQVTIKPWDSARFERAVLDLLHRRIDRPARIAPSANDAAAARGLKVLLVRASSGGLTPLEQALRQAGFGTCVAESDGQAIEILRDAPLSVDVVLVPPGRMGNPIREMIRHSPGLTVVLHPGDWTREETLEAYRAGAVDLLPQGKDPQALADLLVRSARSVRGRRSLALRRAEEERRREGASWPRRALRWGIGVATRRRTRGVRHALLAAAAGALLGAGLAWVVEQVVGGEPPASTSDRLLAFLERSGAKNLFRENDFQKWYLLQRLDLERQQQRAAVLAHDKQTRLHRLDAVLRDVRAEESFEGRPFGDGR